MASPTLFTPAAPKDEALMAVMDQLNQRFGSGTVFPAAAGIARGWQPKAEHRAPRYTTRLDELPCVRA